MSRPEDKTSRTVLAVERVSKSGYYTLPTDENTPHGLYMGRPIIGSGTRIAGGVYLGGHRREAIVVHEHGVLAEAYSNLKSSVVRELPIYKRWLGRAPVQRALAASFDYTRQLMPYDAEIAHEIRREHSDDRKVHLGRFVALRGGVCRHQALLAGFFVERMIDDKFLSGEVHVERNTTNAGTHAWARYIPEQGESYIIDPAQDFVGTETAAQEAHWQYPPFEK